MRDPAKTFPAVVEPSSVATIRIWHCGYRTLAPLAEFRNLEGAEIASFPDDSLEVLSELAKFRYLRILHLPKVKDLSPLGELGALEVLRLHTLPSWDAAGRRTEVTSLGPIATLKNLEAVELFGVVPADLSVSSLAGLPRLRSARLQGFPHDLAKACRAIGVDDDFAPEPWF